MDDTPIGQLKSLSQIFLKFVEFVSENDGHATASRLRDQVVESLMALVNQHTSFLALLSDEERTILAVNIKPIPVENENQILEPDEIPADVLEASILTAEEDQRRRSGVTKTSQTCDVSIVISDSDDDGDLLSLSRSVNEPDSGYLTVSPKSRKRKSSDSDDICDLTQGPLIRRKRRSVALKPLAATTPEFREIGDPAEPPAEAAGFSGQIVQKENDQIPDDVLECLKTSFKLEKFRPNQWKIIKNVLDGKDQFAIMATGYGKSLCFQFPSVYKKQLTVCISPLLALMYDQIKKLNDLDIPAAKIGGAATKKKKTAEM